jgi:hypothetical protein
MKKEAKSPCDMYEMRRREMRVSTKKKKTKETSECPPKCMQCPGPVHTCPKRRRDAQCSVYAHQPTFASYKKNASFQEESSPPKRQR